MVEAAKTQWWSTFFNKVMNLNMPYCDDLRSCCWIILPHEVGHMLQHQVLYGFSKFSEMIDSAEPRALGVMRLNMLKALTKGYIVSARAKGLGQREVINKHARSARLTSTANQVSISLRARDGNDKQPAIAVVKNS